MTIDLDAILKCAADAARSAGDVLTPQLGRTGGLRMKPTGPVTDADLQAEREIVATIRRAFPDHAILSEEMGSTGAGPTRWIIDPLDGTANFIHCIPWYDVSVAFEIDGRIEAGVVFAPSLDLLFMAARSRGTSLNGVPVQTSEKRSLSGSLIDLGFAPVDWKDPALVRHVTRLAQMGAEIRSLNACGLDLAFIAAGWLEGYWDLHVSSWDVAAGSLLVTEAGGRVLSRFTTGPEEKLMVLASNAHLYSTLCELLGLT